MARQLIIFDLDGVLIDSRDAHYSCLNDALESIDKKYVIPYEEHLKEFDGKSTITKLKMLSQSKGLDPIHYDQIWNLKQLLTIQYINENVKLDEELIDIMKYIKSDGTEIACASNSISDTVKMSLLRLGIMEHVDYFLSNENVKNPKPHPEIYFQCMIRSNKSPKEVTIVEDSEVGLMAARRSGAHVIPVKSRQCVRKQLFLKPYLKATTLVF
jgi:HAD superfamily hydrolase (TIGR01509 family)